MSTTTATRTQGMLIQSGILGRMSQENFELFCQEQRDLRIERNEAGELEIMAPTHSLTGRINTEILRQLANWNVDQQLGLVFGSSTGFYLSGKPDTMRAPDASFLLQKRYDALPADEQHGFLPLCPDFVVELKSQSDSLSDLQLKMERYLGYGASIGWLIDPASETVHVYRAEEELLIVSGFDQSLEAGPLMPGFALDLSRLRMA
ncbi:MAG: Uma2 family endonuclease [Bacteroidia bacterium]|nr:Uma2 family endonuclease [Bacteroidia bacterium]